MKAWHRILRAGLAPWIRYKSARSVPDPEGEWTLPGVEAEVRIFRDRWGVPHVYAASMDDLVFAQGWIHAQERLWQMELNRRVAAGRLSEVFGRRALEADRALRTFGFSHLAAGSWRLMTPELCRLVESYARGVNAWIAASRGKLPVEFALLRHEPEPWTPLETISFSQFMMWQLSHAWYGEIIRARIVEAVGAEAAAELEPQYRPDNPLVLPRGISFRGLDPTGRFQELEGPFLGRGHGSNSWVVSGERSATGRPLLANDIHLAMTAPSIWFEMHLEAPGFRVTGASIPGFPFVMAGHNEQIAWGVTLAFTDCEDLFVESFDPDHPQRYRAGSEWREVEVREEKIRVRGEKEPLTERVLSTRHGPIISDLVGPGLPRLAVQSMALRVSPVMEGWLRLNRARGWNEFVESMRWMDAPQLSMTYADVAGNIGLWVTGRVPVRKKGEGMVPAEGASGEWDWKGEIPFEAMPHALNPREGFLVSCNQKLVGENYPHFLGNAWMNGFRARRLSELLDASASCDPRDFEKWQLDTHCRPGRELAELARELTALNEMEERARRLLLDWDGSLDIQSCGGSVYEVFRFTLLRNLLQPALGEELMTRFMGRGFHPQIQFGNEFHGHETVTLLRIAQNPGSLWIRKAGGREKWIGESFRQAVAWLRAELGADPNTWEWGRLHQVTFRHALGQNPVAGSFFNRGPFPVGGDSDTPCQTAISPEEPYACKAWAASFRQIIDLSDFSKSRSCLPPGQSGHPASANYDDQVDDWLHGRYHPMLWTREEVEAAAPHRTRLIPKKEPH